MTRRTTTVARAALVAALCGSIAGVALAAPAPAKGNTTATGPVHAAMTEAVDRLAALAADLAADRSDTVIAHVRALHAALTRAQAAAGGEEPVRPLVAEALRVYGRHEGALTSGDPKRVRKVLHPLTRPLVRYVARFRAGEHRWRTYYCSMAKGAWLQRWADTRLANPYYGKRMLRCGDAVRTVGE